MYTYKYICAVVILKFSYPIILLYKQHKILDMYKYFVTYDGGNNNSLSPPTKEVKYHYPNQITVVTR